MEHKQKAANSASRMAFLLDHSPGHQPFNKYGNIKINRTGKKKGNRKVAGTLNNDG